MFFIRYIVRHNTKTILLHVEEERKRKCHVTDVKIIFEIIFTVECHVTGFFIQSEYRRENNFKIVFTGPVKIAASVILAHLYSKMSVFPGANTNK